ncbi:class II aldolase/adducin family protein [Euzebya sp.]|uniref:class II aldolase/adducin family protein n=1 Tax=Euzebya sp. TaxID=1971409 RepID=UPI0035194D75
MTALRETVATACRVLAREGLVSGILGHVSARTDDDELLIRCRGPQERGLRRSDPDEVWRVSTDARPVDLPDGFALPKEVHIHTALMRRRPEVGAVVHAHPPAALLYGLAGERVRPVIGAYNIPALRLALGGVPVYPRSVLISRPELGEELAEAMGSRDVCVMRGHGIAVTGETVEQAVVRAINLDVLLDLTVKLVALGVTPDAVPPTDLAELPDLGSAFNDQLVWRSLVAEVEAEDRVGLVS